MSNMSDGESSEYALLYERDVDEPSEDDGTASTSPPKKTTTCCGMLPAAPSPGQDAYKAIYESYQSTLQNLMMVSTLFMGFVITGAFINVSYSGAETFSQSFIVRFVQGSLVSFAWSALSFALSLVLSLVGGQCFATKSCCFDAVQFFRIMGFLVLVSELSLYACGVSMTYYLDDFVEMNYVTPSQTLCPGFEYKKHGDTFCAQLGNDLYDAAFKDLAECNKTFNYSSTNQAGVARPFDLSADATPKQRKLAVCNQLDWYVHQLKKYPESFIGDKIVGVWFGWDAYIPKDQGWTGMPADAAYDGLSVIQNNGKILGEVMCHKESTNDKVISLCNKDAENYKERLCAEAQYAYLNADKCAGQKFDDVTKCYHVCKKDRGNKWVTMKEKFEYQKKFTWYMFYGILLWMVLRCCCWCGFYCFTCFEIFQCHRFLNKDEKPDVENYYMSYASQGALGARNVKSLHVTSLTVSDSDEQEGGFTVKVEPLVPIPPPPVTTPFPFTSSSGVTTTATPRTSGYLEMKQVQAAPTTSFTSR